MKLNIYIKPIGIFILAMFFCVTSFAQNNAKKGDRYFDKNLFKDAIKYYRLGAKSKDKKSANYAREKLADCFRILGEFEMAENMYRKLLKSKKNRTNPSYYLNYGKSLKSSAKYAEAKLQFTKYIKLNPSDPMGKIFLHSCDSAQVWLEETIGKELKNVEQINTSASDFAPTLINSKELVFSSSREGTKEALISFDGGMRVYRLDLFKTKLANLSTKESVECDGIKALNSPLHEGSATFSYAGDEVYFTRTIKGKKSKEVKKNKEENKVLSTLQVFYSKKDSLGNWTTPISAFNFNSTEYSIGQPSLSKDGETIFFISDKKGGFGATDIYYSEKREDGTWIEPINAGSNVNTFGYELFPYVANNGTLYFSSDSHIGMGKLDIFSSVFKNDNWQKVQNLKPPYNSIGNDFGIVFDQEFNRGFISSDRFNGKGSEDIYSFSENVPIEIILNGNNLEFVDNAIYDGLKYSLKNITTNEDSTLQSKNGIFSFPITSDEEYLLVAKKNRFSTSNKIEIKVAYNTKDNYLEATVKPLLKPIQLKGNLSEPDLNDTTHTKRLPLTNKYFIISDNGLLEKVKTDANGNYKFKNKLVDGITYTITGSKHYVEEVPEKIILPDSIVIKGAILNKDGEKITGKIIVRSEGVVLNEFNTDANGMFNVNVVYHKEYEVMVATEGYYPAVKNITPKANSNLKEFDLIFKLSLTEN